MNTKPWANVNETIFVMNNIGAFFKFVFIFENLDLTEITG